MTILQNKQIEPSACEQTALNLVAVGRALAKLGKRMVQSSSYDIGELEAIQHDLNAMLEVVKGGRTDVPELTFDAGNYIQIWDEDETSVDHTD